LVELPNRRARNLAVAKATKSKILLVMTQNKVAGKW